MIKYVLKNISLPIEMVDYIYSFIDPLIEIKETKKIRYKRLVSNDFYYNIPEFPIRKYVFKQEEKTLEILLKNKAYNIINNIHMQNLKKSIQ